MNAKEEFFNKFLDSFGFKCFLEEKPKGFCAICQEPAKTLKVSVEIKREKFSRTQSVEYCDYCFQRNIFVLTLSIFPYIFRTSSVHLLALLTGLFNENS